MPEEHKTTFRSLFPFIHRKGGKDVYKRQEYYLNGTEVSKYTEAQRTNLRKGVIGFVFQSFNPVSYTHLDVYKRQAVAITTAISLLTIIGQISKAANINPASIMKNE